MGGGAGPPQEAEAVAIVPGAPGSRLQATPGLGLSSRDRCATVGPSLAQHTGDAVPKYPPDVLQVLAALVSPGRGDVCACARGQPFVGRVGGASSSSGPAAGFAFPFT